MIFTIERTSNDPIGLEGITKVEIHKIDWCMKEFCDLHPDNWFFKNHDNIHPVNKNGHEYYEGIKKKGENAYLYEIKTIEDMKELIEKVGPVIVFAPDCSEGYLRLEIYDDYRE